ncbi:putative colanic acid biosysnthesis UDP-glucose lipid carrier transferase [Algoriphagus locisalis]|uniref:Putative colanic acid biosysnthesis UDP-glucose lipid carrier transferase n=1 Tax=Algoriphagus locisalis TaxID=305507 RepID=A0A1I6Y8G8_9BACT|nr:sugar transferase [Algoriphagus locisalis]SFT46762.1 putative colanic acid biosysnthesis UDP-glucose lipid carrier transferase [Algoriphagus locisalis]
MTDNRRNEIGNFDIYINSKEKPPEGNEELLSKKLNWMNLSIKRFIDLLFAFLFMLTIGWWLFPIVALLIKLESSGPVFFKQEREGIYNSSFHCYKFRSMVINKDANLKMATKNDPRITRVGKFLRKTSIDELPQVLNIIYGNMSWVGPRPHIFIQNDAHSLEIECYRNRHLVKPGITGLAQARGYRGEIDMADSIYFRYRLDMYYIKNWTVLFDLKIIWMTAKSFILGDENAY